jgi:hypothetical protein
MKNKFLLLIFLTVSAALPMSKGAWQYDGMNKGAWQGDSASASCTPATYTGHTPRIDTLGFSGKIGFDTTGAVDSVHLRGWPAGAALLVDDTVRYTWSAVTALSRCSTIVFSCEGESTITIDTITIVSGLRLDSIRPVSGYGGSNIVVYGRNFGVSQGSSTLAFGDSTPTPSIWGISEIRFPCPRFPVSDTGWFDFIVADDAVADTIDSAFHYLGPTAPDPTIDSFSPTSGKRNSTLTLACTDLPDSSAAVRGRLNGVYCTLTRWSADTVKMRVPLWTPIGAYWPIIATVSGGDTTSLDTADTRFRCIPTESNIRGSGLGYRMGR